jgi:hypothetical protein
MWHFVCTVRTYTNCIFITRRGTARATVAGWRVSPRFRVVCQLQSTQLRRTRLYLLHWRLCVQIIENTAKCRLQRLFSNTVHLIIVHNGRHWSADVLFSRYGPESSRNRFLFLVSFYIFCIIKQKLVETIFSLVGKTKNTNKDKEIVLFKLFELFCRYDSINKINSRDIKQ